MESRRRVWGPLGALSCFCSPRSAGPLWCATGREHRLHPPCRGCRLPCALLASVPESLSRGLPGLLRVRMLINHPCLSLLEHSWEALAHRTLKVSSLVLLAKVPVMWKTTGSQCPLQAGEENDPRSVAGRREGNGDLWVLGSRVEEEAAAQSHHSDQGSRLSDVSTPMRGQGKQVLQSECP